MSLIAVGVGMYVAGKVAKKQEWGSKNFQNALIKGGIGVATVGAAQALTSGASALPSTESVLPTAAEGTELASTSIAGESTLAVDAGLLGDTGLGAEIAAEDAMLAGGGEATAVTPTSEGLLAGGGAVPQGNYTASQLAEKGITVEQASGMSSGQLAAIMLGGNVLSSAYSAKAAEEQDDKEWGRESAYGVRNDNKGGTSALNVGSRFNSINNRTNSQPGNTQNFTSRSGGLLS